MASGFPPGTIPARGFDWDGVVFPPRRVGEFADLLYGKSLVENKRTAGSVPVYGTNGRCGWHNEGLHSGPGVILGRKGQGPLGVEWCDGPFWVIDTAYFATVNKDVDLKWFYYIVKYVGLNHLKSGEKPGLQRDTFRAQVFPFPPRDAQTEIADLLSALDAKIDSNVNVNTALAELAGAQFASWFSDFDPVLAKRDGRTPIGVPTDSIDLFPTHFEDSEFGPIPRGWRPTAISELAEINARTLSPKTLPHEIRYIEISDVRRGDVDRMATYRRGSEPSRARRAVRHGDTIVSAVRPERGSYFLCLHPTDGLVVSTGFVVLSPRSRHWALVYCAATGDEALDHYERHAGGGAYPAMRPEAVAAFRIALPKSWELPDLFCSIVDPLLLQAHANREEMKTLSELRETLLGPLLSGELTIKAAKKVLEAAV